MGEATSTTLRESSSSFASELDAILRRLRRNHLAAIGALIIAALVVVAALAPWIAPYDPVFQDFAALMEPPSRAHLFGTDDLGRDIFSRVLYGARYALLLGVGVVAIEAGLGTLFGFLAGYYGGWVDAAVSRVIDVMLSIPTLVLALAIAGAMGGGLINMVIAIGLSGWTEFARLVRGQVLVIRQTSYVEAARALGLTDTEILIRHVAPNTLAPVIVYATLYMPSAILWAASLSFLGLGAQPPTPEWGAMVADGRNYLATSWWIATFPGLAIMVTVLGFNLLGDGLRDALDPRLARRA